MPVSFVRSWSKLVLLVGVAAISFSMSSRASADDIINVNLSAVAPQYRFAFEQAEAFWDGHIQGYSNKLPLFVRRQLGDINIVASSPFIDGAGGILGQAGPTRTVDYGGAGPGPKRSTQRSISIAQEAIMQFDIADLEQLRIDGDLVDVVMHEMAHALGFGSLWAANELISPDLFGTTQYRHDGYAMAEYRNESGNPFANFIPIEQQGGPGTALGHWDDDDPFFNQTATNFKAELMLGFLNHWIDVNGNGVQDAGEFFSPEKFVSKTTLGSFADLWFVVGGINEGEGADVFGWPFGRPKRWRGPGPGFLDMRYGPSSIPEPGTLAGLAVVGMIGLARRRRRS